MCIRDRNKDGFIQGMKIRLDDDAARKYRWLSSRSSRMENGTRSYSWIHVTGDTTQKRAYLTEGPLKGDIASYFANDALFVCLGGVNVHKGPVSYTHLDVYKRQQGILSLVPALIRRHQLP